MLLESTQDIDNLQIYRFNSCIMSAPTYSEGPVMAAKKERKSAVKKSAEQESSQSIEEQTKAFLASGGEIQQINSGVSGQQSVAGPKHINLGSKPQSK